MRGIKQITRLNMVTANTVSCDHSENELGPVEILVNNHSYCALDIFEPAMKNAETFGFHIISAGDNDTNSALNPRSYALMLIFSSSIRTTISPTSPVIFSAILKDESKRSSSWQKRPEVHEIVEGIRTPGKSHTAALAESDHDADELTSVRIRAR